MQKGDSEDHTQLTASQGRESYKARREGRLGIVQGKARRTPSFAESSHLSKQRVPLKRDTIWSCLPNDASLRACAFVAVEFLQLQPTRRVHPTPFPVLGGRHT
eukprot:6212175-Pleurochrysis_carterae.AAC.5